MSSALFWENKKEEWKIYGNDFVREAGLACDHISRNTIKSFEHGEFSGEPMEERDILNIY